MKVLWLAPFPYVDDTNAHPAPWIITLARLLVESGVDLTILNYNSKIKEKVVKKNFNGIKLIYLKTPSLKQDILTLYKIRIQTVKQYLQTIIGNYDLLHIHGTEHQYEVMAKGLNVPTVISIQGIISEVVKVIPFLSNIKIYIEWKLSSLYEKKYLRNYTYFSCRTHWDTDYIRSVNPLAKIYSIWEIIREEFFEDHFSNDIENILFVGGKNPMKGLKELLEAFDHSLQSKGLKLIILGNCQNEDIKNIAARDGFSNIDFDNIECRGMQDAQGMIKAYDESFCLVHPTYIDNSPNSVCEAQLSGLPVIATNVGGVSSLIEDGKTGLLMGRGSKEIEHAVNTLLSDDELRKNISQNSRYSARNRHDLDQILQQTLNMYNDMLSEK